MDDTFGWLPKPYYSYSSAAFPDNAGGHYPVSFAFKKHGFRAWPDELDTTKKRLLFIGDSFTESLECADENTFYNIVGNNQKRQVYAFGCSGYGTLQELMIARQFIDSIKPNYVVLEMCSNDFADNYPDLEEITGYKVGQRRPYMISDDTIEYHHPHYIINDVKKYSLFGHFLVTKCRNALIRLGVLSTSTADDIKIVQQELGHPVYKKSYLVTANLLHKIKQLADEKGATLIVFLADNLQPTSKHLKEICLANNVVFIDGVADSVHQHQIIGETVRAYDGHHWNTNGHSIVARVLNGYFGKE
ncbi:MAG TPA: SGNH/GDSL hydrolase family protein [Chitinophagales bacterium]|nr:SGNH/GDSL hydrolase family protein [Chitinophagales bacterium]